MVDEVIQVVMLKQYGYYNVDSIVPFSKHQAEVLIRDGYAKQIDDVTVYCLVESIAKLTAEQRKQFLDKMAVRWCGECGREHKDHQGPCIPHETIGAWV